MGRFEHKCDDTIVVNSVRIPLSLFLQMEPSYSTPVSMRSQTYIQGKGRVIVSDENYSISGPWIDGDRYISREREFAAAVFSENLETIEAEKQVKELERQLAVETKPTTTKRKTKSK